MTALSDPPFLPGDLLVPIPELSSVILYMPPEHEDGRLNPPCITPWIWVGEFRFGVCLSGTSIIRVISPDEIVRCTLVLDSATMMYGWCDARAVRSVRAAS